MKHLGCEILKDRPGEESLEPAKPGNPKARHALWKSWETLDPLGECISLDDFLIKLLDLKADWPPNSILLGDLEIFFDMDLAKQLAFIKAAYDLGTSHAASNSKCIFLALNWTKKSQRTVESFCGETHYCAFSLGRRGGPGSNGGCSYLGCATEGGCRAVGLDVLLAEPKVSKDNVSLGIQQNILWF